MKKREEVCENMRNPNYEEPEYDLYDKVVRDSICETASSFYNTYDITTKKRLYNNDSYNGYVYNTQYQAYTLSKSKGYGAAIVIMSVGLAAILVLLQLEK